MKDLYFKQIKIFASYYALVIVFFYLVFNTGLGKILGELLNEVPRPPGTILDNLAKFLLCVLAIYFLHTFILLVLGFVRKNINYISCAFLIFILGSITGLGVIWTIFSF